MIHQEDSHGYTIRIHQDNDPDSPRNWENLGHMVCFHSRYRLGDPHTWKTPGEFRESNTFAHAAVILPLYLYDHSGITMRTADFGDRWDSGQVGWIYVNQADMRREYGHNTEEDRENARKVLEGEVETYDQFLTGQVYGYTITDRLGEEPDSCWGFYGLDAAIQAAKDAVKVFMQTRQSEREVQEQHAHLTE